MPGPHRRVELLLEELHRVVAVDRLLVAVVDGQLGHPRQRRSELVGQVGDGGTAGVEHVVGGAVELGRQRTEGLGAPGLEQVERQAVLLAGPLEQLGELRGGAERLVDLELDVEEVLAGRVEVEAEVTVGVPVGVDGRLLPALRGEERVADVVVPLDGVEDPDRTLGLDDGVGERPNRLFVRLSSVVRRHRDQDARRDARRTRHRDRQPPMTTGPARRNGPWNTRGLRNT